nr:hypothetical protein B0A51_03590 [Rachicladosporium sp. CCFEE 5018]
MPPPVSIRTPPPRKDSRIIIHFDYDCFYAAVFEAANPNLKSLPFAVQQKQIIVTCNYEARRRGLHKLQLIREARRICPEVIIELGEDISRFRDASKDLYKFIEGFSWNGKVERLGFDEVWLDVTDMIDFNMETLNVHDLTNSFFQMSKRDPTAGFGFDAGKVAGHAYPEDYAFSSNQEVDQLTFRLRLGSHLAMYIRHELEREKGYTCTVGIATNKVLSKLVGNLHKPKGQTVLMPDGHGDLEGPSQAFIGEHDIGKVPGVGFKLSQKIRECILHRPAEFDAGLVYGGTKEKITVADVRENPGVSPEMLEKLLAGPGSPHGIGYKIWCFLHGVDDTEVSQMRAVPRQISIEDSYIRLDTMPELLKELDGLAKSLLTRMRIDLLGDEDHWDEDKDASTAPLSKKWLAHPKTLRLTTRPRKALLADGTRPRSFKRISHSAPLPTFVFSLVDSIDVLADKLVKEALAGMFRKLHPEKAGWNLSLVNLAVTNMAETGGESKTANGRDISGMFRRQEDVLKDFRVIEDVVEELDDIDAVHEIESTVSIARADDVWDDGEEDESEVCGDCGLRLPEFAMLAHQRYHLVDP